MKAARVLNMTPSNTAKESFEPYLIGVGTSTPARQVIELARSSGLRHFVHSGGLAYEAEITLSRLMIARPERFFDDPVGAILGSAKTEDDGFVFRGPHDAKKSDFLAEFEAYLRGLPGVRRVREEAMMVADELFTNGSKHAFPNRKLSLAKSRGEVEFSARCDGERLALACTDSFGLLDVQKPLARIARCMDDGVATSIQHGPGGAGIGSYLVFNASSSYCLAVDRGKKSAVACALPVETRERETSPSVKNLHIFVSER